jgi:hypothetical protein
MTCQSRPPWFEHPHNIWWWVQVTFPTLLSFRLCYLWSWVTFLLGRPRKQLYTTLKRLRVVRNPDHNPCTRAEDENIRPSRNLAECSLSCESHSCSSGLKYTLLLSLEEKLIIVLTKACLWTLSWTSSVESQSLHPVSLTFILLSSHLCLGLLCDYFPWGFPTIILYIFSFHLWLVAYYIIWQLCITFRGYLTSNEMRKWLWMEKSKGVERKQSWPNSLYYPIIHWRDWRNPRKL